MKAWLITFAVAISLVDPAISHAGQPLGPASYYPGATPFISVVQLTLADLANVRNAQFQIAPKAGSATRPINVKYSRKYLQKRGYLNRGLGQLNIPVFGLYAGRSNTVTITVGFRDGTTQVTEVAISTPAYDGGTYSNPTVVQARLPGTTLSYDFILLKSYADPTTPIIIDTDGEVRWIGTANIGTQNVALFDNAFYLGAGSSLYRTEFDGTTTTLADYSGIGVTGFHHNIDPGKTGIILDVDTVNDTECVNLEVDKEGNVLKTWNLADIVSAAMVAGGDNPNGFVKRAPIDWFHNNATAYRASDNSLIVSSRENFVIAIDYDSGAIKWILGDTTKKWHQFLSLRAFCALSRPRHPAADRATRCLHAR